MEKIKNFSLIFLCLLISCCSVKTHTQVQDNMQMDNMLGKYVKDDSPYKNPNSEEIILFSNNVVNYNLSLELYGTHSLKGTWELKKDSLSLFFDIPSEKVNGDIKVQYEREKQSKVDLLVVDNDGNALYGNTIFINGKEHFISSKSLEIKPQFIDNIKVDFYGEIYEKKIDKYVDGNMKIILTPNQWRNVIYDFVKTKWLVQGHKLIAINNDKVDQKYFLIKNK